MTLEQVLDKLPSDYIVKVGCNSAFFYCYYNDKNAKARINEQSLKQIEFYQKILDNRINAYKTLDSRYAHNVKRVKASKELKKAEKEKKIEKLTQAYEKGKTTYPKAIEKAQKRLDSYLPYIKRKVVNAYQLNMPMYESEKTLYLVIQGNDVGRYNDLNEYAEEHNLPIRKEDNKWAKILEYRKHPHPIESAKIFVKPNKKAQYKVLWDNDGQALGLVERKMGE
jgi:hypothetical protein